MYPSPPATLPAATRVYQHLKRAILEQIHAGGALLTEVEIATQVGVSRTPVREALLRLQAEGLVTLYPKRGALVLPISAAEIEDVIEARRLVEVHAAARAWARRDSLAPTLTPLLAAMRAAHERDDVVGLMTADREFHAAVVAAGGNAILTDLYQRLRDRQMRIGVASMRAEPQRRIRALHDHGQLLDALLAPDAQQWTTLVEQHIGTAELHLRPAR
jgi:DNA-binding GntR family transcriptional regulator